MTLWGVDITESRVYSHADKLPTNLASLEETYSNFMMLDSNPTWRKGNHYMQAYLSFIQHKSLEIVCILEVMFLYLIDTKIISKDLELVYLRSFEMNWRQTNNEGVKFLC